MSKTSRYQNFGNSIFCTDKGTILITCFFLFNNPKIVQPNKVSTADKPDVNTSILPVKMLPSTSAPRRILIGSVSLPTSFNTMFRQQKKFHHQTVLEIALLFQREKDLTL
ncbi:hypothetical protein CEXT_625171 [Caerostris extrusa]|uniref:Uncharacterized protein n=1 Tax=Caerostris extrusa TaxID=172846 RepID=A0AAV4VZK0_CAEEX|nr:hypothetical protein CEXT_625171 [Caerostris extrusa]